MIFYMEFQEQEIAVSGVKIILSENGQELGHAHLYILKNGVHEQPFAFLEYVLVKENQRGRGFGTKIIERALEIAKSRGCYKLICTSRYGRDKLHQFYERFGLKDHGKEFRIDF